MKRKRMTFEEVQQELQEVQETNRLYAEQQAEALVVKIIKKIQRGQYRMVNANKIEVAVWTFQDWLNDDRETLIGNVGRKYHLHITPQLCLTPRRTFHVSFLGGRR